MGDERYSIVREVMSENKLFQQKEGNGEVDIRGFMWVYVGVRILYYTLCTYFIGDIFKHYIL